MTNPENRRWLALICISVIVPFATLVSFYLASIATEQFGKTRYRAVIEDAVATGALVARVTQPLAPERTVWASNFNDCLILSMLVLPERDSLALRAISPRVPDQKPWDGVVPAGYPPFVQCRDLAGIMTAPGEMQAQYYHRYLHGDWILAKVMLAIMPFAAASHLLLAVLVALLATLTCLSLRAAWRSPERRGRNLAYAALAVGWLIFGSHQVFGRSFSFAPANIVIASFMLYFYRNPPSRLGARRFAAACALFGSLTAMFEFLTGSLPEGVMLLLAAVAFDLGDSRTLMRRAVGALAAFGGAAVLCFAIKMSIVAAIWGSGELGIFGHQIGAHMSAGGWDVAPENAAIFSRLGLDPASIRASLLLSYAYALSKVAYFSQHLAFGSAALGAILTIAAPLTLVGLSLWRLRQTRDDADRVRMTLVLSACLVMPVWYFVFIHHTIVHAHFMFRPMVWPLAMLMAAQAWAGIIKMPAQEKCEESIRPL